MTLKRICFFLTFFVLSTACTITIWADTPTEMREFVRIHSGQNGEVLAFETAIASYRSTKDPKVSVDLIAAVHVGDVAYYENLNKRFEQYDALLYELVAPQGVIPDPEVKHANPLSSLQRTLKDVLHLDFQLDHIDYKKANFVHADMTPDQFFNSMSDRGESIWAIMTRVMVASLAKENQQAAMATELSLLFALLAPNRALAFKRVLAKEFMRSELMINALNGKDGSTLITERNKTALKVLEEQINKGKTRFGIFYGAAHLPDMEEQLLKRLGFRRESVEWIPAWDLK